MTMPGFDPEFASAAEWARLYRFCSIQVVPAFMPGEARGANWKRPLLKNWKQYQDQLVSDEVFDQWYGPLGQYRQRPNMGTICGNASDNLMVVDLDVYKKPDALRWWLNLLELHNARLELETVEQRTGGGGLQKLFHCPPGWAPPTCKTPIGIDIRGQGGFAMLCPSMHESGKAYEWLDGRSPDDIEILMAPDWLLEAVEALVVEHGGSGPASRETHQRGANGQGEAFDGFGHQTDLREQKMTELVWGVLVDMKRARPMMAVPSERELRLIAAEKYLVYESLVSPRVFDPARTKTEMLELEDRGPSMFWRKIQYAMKQWAGKISEEAAKPAPRGPAGKSGAQNARNDFNDFTDEYAARPKVDPATGQPQLLDYLNVDQILAMPDPVWLIEDLINEQSLGFVFGPPGSLKTFVALDMAMSIVTSRPAWWNRPIKQHGAVIYLCREGTRSLKFRLKAWQQYRGVSISGKPFYLIEKTLNFMNGQDVGVLAATIEVIAAAAGVPIVAVFVDTVSRVLPGARENQQEDMSLFVGACEYIQQRFGCVVIGIHHTNKNGGIRGSTVIPGAGDFLLEMRREPGVMSGSMMVQKVKDGEDGQELSFKVVKVTLGGIVAHSSLMVDPDDQPRAAQASKDGVPDIMVCREILSALALAWFNQMPWGSADNGARPAVRLIMARWSLKREPVRKLLDGWMANGVIEYAVYDTKAKAFGYRKLVDI